MRRFMQVVLYVNIAIVAVIGFTGYVLHVGPEGVIGGKEPILGHELAAIYLGYAALCLVVLSRFQREPTWLLAPALFLLPLWLDSLYELPLGTRAIPPVFIRPILLACYVAGYIALRRAAQYQGAIAAQHGQIADAPATR